MEYVGNLCSPCPLQLKRLIYISRLCTIQLHVCLTALACIRRKYFAGNFIMHVLSLTITKGNISQNFEGCRQTFEGYKMIFVYALQ